MKSEDEHQHVLNAEQTVNVPLDYADLDAIVQELEDEPAYDNLRRYLEEKRDESF